MDGDGKPAERLKLLAVAPLDQALKPTANEHDVLAAFVGLVDGLVRRDVRRFGAGRESGFLHHRAKAALAPLAMPPWMVSGLVHLAASAADPAAQRRLAGLGRESDGGQLQEVSMARRNKGANLAPLSELRTNPYACAGWAWRANCAASCAATFSSTA
jgi:hypothetical protein